MKILLMIIATFLVFITLNINSAFADTSKSIITVNDTQYQIVFNTVNSTVNTILPDLHSYMRNSLDMNITSDKVYNGSMTLTLSKDAVASVFCIRRDSVDNYVRNSQGFFAIISNNYENLRTSTTDDKASFTFDIQAGSKNATIVNQFVGMEVAQAVDFKGIAEAGKKRQKQQVILYSSPV